MTFNELLREQSLSEGFKFFRMSNKIDRFIKTMERLEKKTRAERAIIKDFKGYSIRAKKIEDNFNDKKIRQGPSERRMEELYDDMKENILYMIDKFGFKKEIRGIYKKMLRDIKKFETEGFDNKYYKKAEKESPEQRRKYDKEYSKLKKKEEAPMKELEGLA